jgi:hypothetical protein
MPTHFLGGCACGAIRYECSAEPIAMINCHCRDCQRSSGTAFSSVVVVPVSAVKLLNSEPKHHAVRAESENIVRRGFCCECGSPLFADSSARSDILAIKAGSLDDPSWFKPTVDIWTASAQPWDYMNPDLAKIAKHPPMRKTS